MNMKKRSATNYGIQAEVVRAEALAVGENARAMVTASQHQEGTRYFGKRNSALIA